MTIKAHRLRCIWTFLVILLFSLHAHADWRSLESGLEYKKVEEIGGHFFRIDPKRHRLDLLLASDYGASALTAQRFRERSGALLVINGGFFDEAFRSLGLLIRKGQLVNPVRNASWGIFFLGGLDGKEPGIIPRREWNGQGVAMAIQVGPRLLIDGKIPTFKETGPAPRSGVCVTADGQVEIAMSESPLSLRQWAEFLQRDCFQALNLDGGGSSQISVKASSLSLDVAGLTGVPNAVAVFRDQGSGKRD